MRPDLCPGFSRTGIDTLNEDIQRDLWLHLSQSEIMDGFCVTAPVDFSGSHVVTTGRQKDWFESVLRFG